MRGGQLLQALLELLPPRGNVLGELFPLDHVEDRERHRAGQRRSAVSRAVTARTKNILVRLANPDRADRITGPERLGHRDGIGRKIFRTLNSLQNPLVTLPPARPEIAVLHAVPKEEQVVLPGQFPQAKKVFRRGCEDAALALDALDQHGDGLRRDRGLDRGQIVVGNMGKAGEQRIETVLDLLLTRGGEGRHRPAMERIERGDDFVPARTATAAGSVAEFPRQLDQRLVGFRAAVAEKDLARPGQPDDPLRQPPLPFVVIEIGAVNQHLGLLREGFPDCGVRMAETAHRDTAAEVEIFPALVIPDVPPPAPGQREAPVDCRHDVLIVERLDLRARGRLRMGRLGRGRRFHGQGRFDRHLRIKIRHPELVEGYSSPRNGT